MIVSKSIKLITYKITDYYTHRDFEAFAVRKIHLGERKTRSHTDSTIKQAEHDYEIRNICCDLSAARDIPNANSFG